MIHIENLHKRHDQLHVLRGVSLTVARGEVAVLIGPSGGGKSTLLRCVNGLEVFQQGAVRVGEVRHGWFSLRGCCGVNPRTKTHSR